MTLTYSEMIDLGSEAPGFNLPGIDGQDYTLESFDSAEVLVVVFMCNHCPYVQACIDRLCALQNDLEESGVVFVGINSNDSDTYEEDSFEKMEEYAEDWGMNFVYLKDATQKVAKAYNAVCTPDIFVYDKDRKLVYRGRIDDQWQDEDLVTEEDLRYALEDIVEGKEVSVAQRPSMGCSIKWME
jgi:peroxiredoxin